MERGTIIGRLRVHAAARDAVALRMRSEAVLRSVELQSVSLPPQAILCIRALRDPLPRSLDLGGRDAASRVAWQRAACDSIQNLARRAVRPALESVPAAAEAVLFLDRAELLACAARDAVRGLLAHEWWWRHLFDVHGGLSPVVHEWLREPRCVPAVVALLARRRADVVTVARSIAPEGARRIVEAVLREHALPSVAYAVVRALSQSTTSVIPQRTSQPHWIELVPEATEPALSIEQQLIIAVPLLLQRAPAVVRAPAFETTILRWIAARRASVSQPVTDSLRPGRTRHHTRVATKSSTLAVVPSVDGPGSITAAVTPAITVLPRSRATLQIAEADPAPERSADAQRHGVSETPIQHRQQTETHTQREIRAPEETPTAFQHLTHEELRRDITFDPAPRMETEFTSDFAGALFLFNAGIALGFYSDFTSPTQRGIGLDVFLFVDRVGRALAGNAFARDPLHAFLRRSASHAPRWTPPPVLAAYPNAPRRDRWIAAVANHLRLRLGARLARQLVTVPGRITTSLLHLDVHFSLAAHPIEIRIAGLDRNPGWIPAAGRHVAFHFA